MLAHDFTDDTLDTRFLGDLYQDLSKAARKRFAEARRMEVHKAFFSPYLAALSHNIAALLPGDLSVSYFPNSGAEANEGAIKMAYKYHGGRRNTILRADISFHGKTLGAGSLTGSSENSFRFASAIVSISWRSASRALAKRCGGAGLPQAEPAAFPMPPTGLAVRLDPGIDLEARS